MKEEIGSSSFDDAFFRLQTKAGRTKERKMKEIQEVSSP